VFVRHKTLYPEYSLLLHRKYYTKTTKIVNQRAQILFSFEGALRLDYSLSEGWDHILDSKVTIACWIKSNQTETGETWSLSELQTSIFSG